MAVKESILKQIDDALSRFQTLTGQSKYTDISDLPILQISMVATAVCDCIRRFAPRNSYYIESMDSINSNYGPGTNARLLPLGGILSALREAYQNGYLDDVTQLIHADLFSDFLEMADYLSSEGYKDPAAVIVGSVLEEHLRQLCSKNGIPVENAGKPKKADLLNADLAAAMVYSKLDQKSITGWLDLRNKAAHGKYGDYTKDQVALLLQGVRDFMVRIPA
jgi:hypothetical protein